jgi:hypothetical protein
MKEESFCFLFFFDNTEARMPYVVTVLYILKKRDSRIALIKG